MSTWLLILPALAALAALAVLAVLAACTTAPRHATSSMSPHCDADAARRHLGQAASEDAIETARKAARADLVRVIKPGQAVTLDLRGERLNLYLDDAGLIARASCG